MLSGKTVTPMTPAVVPVQNLPPRDKPRLHLDYLDGLRGLAALYVVIFHVYYDAIYSVRSASLSPLKQLILFPLTQGRFAVDVFIVLSGFCLMLPIARSPDGRLPGGFWSYIKRRARRILPPYYCALAMMLVLIALIPDLRHTHGTHWDIMLPAFTPGALISHLLLIHNLSNAWIYKIDGAMWSVATEW